MQGEHYWYTGISTRFTLATLDAWGWTASLKFHDNGFNSGHTTADATISTEGTLITRYVISDPASDYTKALETAVSALLEDANKLGLRFSLFAHPEPPPDGFTFLFNDGQGWDEDWDEDAPISQDEAHKIMQAVNDRLYEQMFRTGKVLTHSIPDIPDPFLASP